MTGHLTDIPYTELHRIHQQAKIGLLWAPRNNHEDLYRSMDDLETRARREKVRRKVEREGPA